MANSQPPKLNPPLIKDTSMNFTNTQIAYLYQAARQAKWSSENSLAEIVEDDSIECAMSIATLESEIENYTELEAYLEAKLLTISDKYGNLV